jgi:hypothetical protein
LKADPESGWAGLRAPIFSSLQYNRDFENSTDPRPIIGPVKVFSTLPRV